MRASLPTITVGLASPRDIAEIALAVADELEELVRDMRVSDSARELGVQLRLASWLLTMELEGPAADAELTRLLQRAHSLLDEARDVANPPPVSTERPTFAPRVTLRNLALADLFTEDDEQTLVRKAKWDASRSTNRALRN
ncbi:MAG: hypothetical protein U0271_11390 [Polyangiaceae bacterium]